MYRESVDLEIRYPCDMCNLFSTSRCLLKSTRIVSTREFNTKCEHCDFSTSFRSQITRTASIKELYIIDLFVIIPPI